MLGNVVSHARAKGVNVLLCTLPGNFYAPAWPVETDKARIAEFVRLQQQGLYEDAARLAGQVWDRADKVGLDALKAANVTITEASPAFIADVRKRTEPLVQDWIKDLAGIAGVTAERGFPSEAGQPHARTLVRLGAGFRKTRDQVVDELKHGDVWIEVGVLADEPNAIALNPQTLTRDESSTALRAAGQRRLGGGAATATASAAICV